MAGYFYAEVDFEDLPGCPFCGGRPMLHFDQGSWGYRYATASLGCKPCDFRLPPVEASVDDPTGNVRGFGEADVKRICEAWERRA